MKIAIIGGGISGASALKAILDHPNLRNEDQIHLFEPREVIGVGLPYSPDDESVMLNVSPDALSVVENNPFDFTEWLDANYENPTNFEGLVSRPQYGNYLAERFAQYANYKQVTHFQETIEDIQVIDAQTKEIATESKNGEYVYRLKQQDGWRNDIYDAVFLAIGHPEYADYYDLKGSENYVSNPYPMKEKLTKLSGNERIGIIGSGATGVDLMRFFSLNYDLQHPLTYYVQDQGFYFADIPYEKESFPFTFSMDWIAEEREKNNGIIPFSYILQTFIEDIQAGGVDVAAVYNRYKKGDLPTIRLAVEAKDQELALIHAYNSKLVQFLPHLYNSLSGQDKEFYLANYHHKLLFFKSRVPFKTFKWLLELENAGQLRVIYGLTDIQPQSDGSFIALAGKKEKVDLFINATGFDSRLSAASKSMPLIHNLFQKNLILPHINGRFVLVDWPQAQIINQRFGLMNNLFFFGLLIGGTQHENNDAYLTYQLATQSANWFMEQRTN